MSKRSSRKKVFNICVTLERIRPGRWFINGDGRKMLKVMDILPSGLPIALTRIDPDTGDITSDFAVNAIDEAGVPCCCPYNMDIFYVKSEDDLYYGNHVGPTVRHLSVTIKNNPNDDWQKRIVPHWPEHVKKDGK